MVAKTKTCATALAVLVTLISVTILGLSAYTVAWYLESRDYRYVSSTIASSSYTVRRCRHGLANGVISQCKTRFIAPYHLQQGHLSDSKTFTVTYYVQQYNNTMYYHPQLTMSDTYSMLATGILGTVLGATILVMSLLRTERSLAFHLYRQNVGILDQRGCTQVQLQADRAGIDLALLLHWPTHYSTP